jgi:hypothetical protein
VILKLENLPWKKHRFITSLMRRRMKLLEKTDEEILEIAAPIWDDLVKYSNNKDYSGFTKHFSAQMLYGANEIEIGKQWANNKLLTSLSKQRKFFGCLRRNNFVTVLFKQASDTVPGDFLGRLVLGVEDDKVKVFGATIF